jgi:hypothetical protein
MAQKSHFITSDCRTDAAAMLRAAHIALGIYVPPTHGPNGGVADSPDEAKAGLRARRGSGTVRYRTEGTRTGILFSHFRPYLPLMLISRGRRASGQRSRCAKTAWNAQPSWYVLATQDPADEVLKALG